MNQQPFLFVDGPFLCHACTQGKLDPKLGYHAFFVTYVPFIPSFLSDDFTRMTVREGSRIKLIEERQIRFLNDLSSCKTGAAETFDLRFVSIPQPDQPYNKIHVFFIGKAFGPTEKEARENAVNLWYKFRSFFPLEDPFNYPLRTISAVVDDKGRERPSEPELFTLALQPIEPANHNTGKLIEIRKYEDRDPMLTSDANTSNLATGYYPHPFRPTIDFSAMSRFLETFAVQPQKCVASICLRPTSLALDEQKLITQMMDRYRILLSKAQEAGNWLMQYRKERYEDLIRTFDPVINQRNHLFTVKIQILGEMQAPGDVVAALGSEIMNNSTKEPRLWNEVAPATPEEMEIAVRNFSLMEYAPWSQGNTNSPIWRLSSLVTSYEAVGAFRLPVPPESGHMPGISVHDDPFVLPASTPFGIPDRSGGRKVSLGKIIHRGVQTDTDFYVTLSQLKRHALVAGSTGSGKTNTCLHLLTELWREEPKVPFLVIYPIDKPDYRLLMADKGVNDNLLIFTVGDDTASPFRFNPFAVPPGILVRTHMSLLMRAFAAAFTMWDPLPAIYRAALRRVYEEAGYRDLTVAKGGDAGTHAPILSRFYEILVETAEIMTQEYGTEVKGNVRQGAEIRMRDLLLNAGHVLNVNEGAPWELILDNPTVMEIGRVGSSEDTALVMGFLLMSLTSNLASRSKREINPRQHITLIEEAHRLMAAGGRGGASDSMPDPRNQASEDFAHMLAEVRGYGEGLMIAEQIPTELVSGAIGNTYLKIMHWLEEQGSFELFCDIMSLNNQQRDYARILPVGEAILRDLSGRPVLVKVKNYLDDFQHPDDSPIIDDSDTAVHKFMQAQVAQHALHIPDVIDFQTSLDRTRTEESPAKVTTAYEPGWYVRLPMKTCAFCKVYRESGMCRYGRTVRKHFVSGLSDETAQSPFQELVAQETLETCWLLLPDVAARVETRLNNATAEDAKGTVYCVLAHELDRIVDPDSELSARKRASDILAGFEDHYRKQEA